jgi:hypothetical protein
LISRSTSFKTAGAKTNGDVALDTESIVPMDVDAGILSLLGSFGFPFTIFQELILLSLYLTTVWPLLAYVFLTPLCLAWTFLPQLTKRLYPFWLNRLASLMIPSLVPNSSLTFSGLWLNSVRLLFLLFSSFVLTFFRHFF